MHIGTASPRHSLECKCCGCRLPQEKLEALLGGITVLDDASGKCTITKVESMTGSVTVQ